MGFHYDNKDLVNLHYNQSTKKLRLLQMTGGWNDNLQEDDGTIKFCQFKQDTKF